MEPRIARCDFYENLRAGMIVTSRDLTVQNQGFVRKLTAEYWLDGQTKGNSIVRILGAGLGAARKGKMAPDFL